MNLGDVKVRVKRTFGDESAVQVTDDDIVRWTNDAIRGIVLANEGLLEKTQTVNLVVNQQEYPLPQDCLILKGVTTKNVVGAASYFRMRGYELAAFNEYIDGWDGNIYGSGNVSIYTVFANTLRLFPIPAANVADGLKLYYNRIPNAVVSDQDVPELPVVYHNAIVNYCLQQAYELDEDWQTANYKASQMAGDVHLARNRDSWKTQETYPMITVANDDRW